MKLCNLRAHANRTHSRHCRGRRTNNFEMGPPETSKSTNTHVVKTQKTPQIKNCENTVNLLWKYCEFTVINQKYVSSHVWNPQILWVHCDKYKILWVYCEFTVKTKKAHVCNSKKNNVCKSKNHKHCKMLRLCQNIIRKFGTGQMRNAKRPKRCCRPSGPSQQQRPKLVGEYTTTTLNSLTTYAHN